MLSLAIMLVSSFSTVPLVLENEAIRVEVEPKVFSLRFVGFPGGLNFLEALPLSEKALEQKDWLDPGGLVSDLLPMKERDAALRRGPASVLEHSKTRIVLLGPLSEATGLRLKKELHLYPEAARLRYTVTVLSNRRAPQEVALRNTVRLPAKSTIRTAREAMRLEALAGMETLAPVVVTSNRYWLIPIPPAGRAKGAVIGGTVGAMSIQNPSGLWKRSAKVDLKEDLQWPAGGPFLCVLDDPSRSYGVALQSPLWKVSTSAPLVFVEEWDFESRLP
jgi:hypothetical protein